MKFIAGSWFVVIGYTLVYYGVSMWRYYNQSGVVKKGAKGLEGYDPDGIPMGVLLGLQKPASINKAIHSTPPFNLGGTIYGTTSHTSALDTQTPTPTTGPMI